jgi:hypothetical protein
MHGFSVLIPNLERLLCRREDETFFIFLLIQLEVSISLLVLALASKLT